jgi:hypothetical protein
MVQEVFGIPISGPSSKILPESDDAFSLRARPRTSDHKHAHLAAFADLEIHGPSPCD